MPRDKHLLRSMFDAVFHKPITNAVNGYFSTFTAYSPRFTTWQGGLYEAELTRSIIERGADHASKLKPEVLGATMNKAARSLERQPNPWMTTPQFIKRVYTMLQVNNTALIVPLFADDEVTHIGYYPVLPNVCEARDVNGDLWLRLMFPDGREALVEWDRVGVLTRNQYRSDLFGDAPNALDTTLDLMHAQDQAEKTAISQGASIRFIGKLSQNRDPKDAEKARIEFNKQLAPDNAGGIAVYDKLFTDIVQIQPQSYTVDAAQMERIEKAAYRYFGSCEDVVMNRADEQTYNAYYEGNIEVFAVQLASVLTSMTFTYEEMQRGCEIMLSANRLEFASNQTKLQVATALFDRGIWCGNQIADVFQSPHYEGGDRHVIRGEYIDLDLISEHTADQAATSAQTNAAISTMENNAKGGGSDAAEA